MTKSDEASTATGRGMSRAAKKRAKKKQKQSKHHPVERVSNDVGGKNDDDECNKRPLIEQDEAPTKKEPSRKRAKNQPQEEEQDEVDVMIHKVLSKLTPLEILQRTNLDKEEATILGQQVQVSDLLQETTTQQRARALFQSLLGNTVSLQEFYGDYWEQQPLYIPAAADEEKSRFDGILSKAEMKQQLETHPTYYGKDLNVTRYDEGADGVKRRITLDPQPDNDEEEFCLVDAKDAWENYKAGCSLRLLCPHKHNDALHSLLSLLEFEWGCMVGANVYLTPPGASQGFAPHYDDIEAFCIQLEGYKHWKVYAPLNKRETLPRESSADYTEDDLKGMEPVLDVVLGPGDVLYMPRGWIHQAVTTNRQGHSLHLTISAMQQWAWADFLELLLPQALEAAAASDISTSLRQGLPLRFLNYMGAVHDDTNDDLPEGFKTNAQNDEPKSDGNDDSEAESGVDEALDARKIKALREAFREEATKRIMRVSKEALSMLDAACDQIGKRFISDRLPPALTAAEAESTSESNTSVKIWPNTLVRLVRPGVARLALEDEKAILYHCIDNSRVYQGNPLSPMEFELDDAPALEALLTTVEPRWIQVQDLIHDDVQDKMEIAQSLYDEGLLSVLQTEAPDKSVQVG